MLGVVLAAVSAWQFFWPAAPLRSFWDCTSLMTVFAAPQHSESFLSVVLFLRWLI